MGIIDRLRRALAFRPAGRPQEGRAYAKAVFADPDDLLRAAQALKGRGAKIVDAYTPFPVHGLDDALGEKPSRLPWVTGLLGLVGAAGAAALQYWTSVHSYPLIVGGKPLNSAPAFLPICFELTVLVAGLGTVATLFLLARLRPRFRIPDAHEGANDDRFILIVQVDGGAPYGAVEAAALAHHATKVERFFLDPPGPHPFWDRPAGAMAMGLAVILPPAVILGLGVQFNRDFTRRVLFFDAGMSYPVSAQAYDANPVLRGGEVLQAAPAGTLARGQQAFAFAPGQVEAERAGRELGNPFKPDAANLDRGAVVWTRVCAACHGAGAKGDGESIGAGRFPNPPNLLIPKYRDYPDGRLFHVATFGGPQGLMKGMRELVTPDDRWKAILYLRKLQAEFAAKQALPAAAPAPAPLAGAKP